MSLVNSPRSTDTWKRLEHYESNKQQRLEHKKLYSWELGVSGFVLYLENSE